MRLYIGLLFWASFHFLMAQTAPVMPKNLYLIRNPGTEFEKYCGKCRSMIDQMPVEEHMGVTYIEADNSLYFVISSKAWFDKFFVNPFDGVSADIVLKEQYNCGVEPKATGYEWLCNGYLIPPVYTADLKKKVQLAEDGYVWVNLGPLPPYFKGKTFEVNFMLLNNRSRCYYSLYFNLNKHKWDLLEMGMYMDTLTEDNIYERSSYLSKLMKFEIPFKKDKAEYQTKDIKPLYDSLKLNNYIIRSVSIHAYSSVEGTTERNLELQDKRSQSIVKALQSLQAINFDTVRKEIHSSENWVDFYGSIVDGRFSYLNDLNKEEIKAKLNSDKSLLTNMEPLLSKHRKAVVILELEPKSGMPEKDPEKVREMYAQSLSNNNVKEALRVQKEIFMRIRSNKLPEDFLSTLEVPEGKEFGLLRNSKLGFQFQEENIDVFTAYKQYRKLADIMPDNHRVKYNLCVLQLKGWLSSELIVDPAKLKLDIEALNKLPIDKRLIKRLQINYNILLCEKLMEERKYDEKNEALKIIYDYYAYLKLSEADLVSLAQYFTSYSREDWSKKLLYPYAKKIDVGEDLLFYYINLTIAFDEIVSANQYKPILLNARDINKKRFCQLFNQYGVENGVTFQLLANPDLKAFYCETCK